MNERSLRADRKEENMRPGEQLTLQIDNEMEYGYFLTDGEDSVLLHRSEMTEDIEIVMK